MEAASEKQWYYSRAGVRHGPVPFHTLKELAAGDQIDRFNDMAWAEGMAEWVPASQVEGLFTDAPPPPLPAGGQLDQSLHPPLKRASFGLFVFLQLSYIPVMLLAAGIFAAAEEQNSDGMYAVGALLFFVGIGLFAGAIAVAAIYVYRMWLMIQDGHARTTPGKAAGFLFIPLFNLYWVFVAFFGWSQDYNRFMDTHGLAEAPRMPQGLFQALAILFAANIVVQYIPVLDVLMLIAVLIVNLTAYHHICRAINFMADHERSS
jgi:hypothetical protein